MPNSYAQFHTMMSHVKLEDHKILMTIWWTNVLYSSVEMWFMQLSIEEGDAANCQSLYCNYAEIYWYVFCAFFLNTSGDDQAKCVKWSLSAPSIIRFILYAIEVGLYLIWL